MRGCLTGCGLYRYRISCFHSYLIKLLFLIKHFCSVSNAFVLLFPYIIVEQ